MTSVCLYFKVHQPYRLALAGSYTGNRYNTTPVEQFGISRLADACYLPANELLWQLIEQQQGHFNISFSISGTVIELLQRYRPGVIESFRRLVNTGCVEILAETYYHSLASLHSQKEWRRQVTMHSEKVQQVFGVTPVIYRNTELIHNNTIAAAVAEMNVKGILCEGVERILEGRSANRIYKTPGGIPLLLRNARLSDDIAFRFDDHSWSEHPLTANKFAEWLHSHPTGTDVINLFIDYETFGIHKEASTGIFDFLQALPAEVLKHEGFAFALPSELLGRLSPVDEYNVTKTTSWEDRVNAACVWSENSMQHNMLHKIYSLENMVLSTGDEQALAKWGQLQSADHFYYMTRHNEKYRNPYSTGQEAYEQYIEVINDFEINLIRNGLEQVKKSVSSKNFASSIL